MRKLLFFILLITIGCKKGNSSESELSIDTKPIKSQSEIDRGNGFRDLKLGRDIGDYKDRIRSSDISATDSTLKVFYLKDSIDIAKGCELINIQVVTLSQKIMEIEAVVNCPDINVVLTNKYGVSRYDGVTHTWHGDSVRLTSVVMDGTFRGLKYNKLRFVSIPLMNKYNASKQGNL